MVRLLPRPRHVRPLQGSQGRLCITGRSKAHVTVLRHFRFVGHKNFDSVTGGIVRFHDGTYCFDGHPRFRPCHACGIRVVVVIVVGIIFLLFSYWPY